MDKQHWRGLLEERLRTLAGRHSAIEKHFRGQDGRLEADSGDVGSILSSDEVLQGLDDAARTEIVEIRNAMRRLDEGTFGVCENCGNAIAPKRLEALPHTRRCVKCA